MAPEEMARTFVGELPAAELVGVLASYITQVRQLQTELGPELKTGWPEPRALQMDDTERYGAAAGRVIAAMQPRDAWVAVISTGDRDRPAEIDPSRQVIGHITPTDQRRFIARIIQLQEETRSV